MIAEDDGRNLMRYRNCKNIKEAYWVFLKYFFLLIRMQALKEQALDL